MSEAADTSILSLQTVNADGKAPKRRIATATAAYTEYNSARQYNRKRDRRFGDIAGIFAGLPPTPPVINERNGIADLPNINTRQFQAKVMTYAATWIGMQASGDGFAEVQAEHDDPMEAERRSKVLTAEFNSAIRRWDNPDFESGNKYLIKSAARYVQMGLFGLGINFFRDNIDFRFQVVPTRRVLVPEGTPLDLDGCSAVWIEDQMSVTQLWGMIGKPGWSEEAIKRNLYEHVELLWNTGTVSQTYAQWIEYIRTNTDWLQSEWQPVRVIRMFVEEFDGTISQCAFTDLYSTGKTPTKEEPNNQYRTSAFLYDAPKRAECWSQVICISADNPGTEGDFHGVKGFGDMIFDGCHLNNLMFNKAATGAIMVNTLMFEGDSESDAQKLDQITITNLGILSPGLRMQQIKFAADIEGALSICSYGSQLISENTRISPQNEKTVTGDQPTATQVTADRTDRAQFTTLQISVDRSIGLDPLFGEMYRRIANPNYPVAWGGGKVAKRFHERCEKRGIPKEDLRKVKLVRANRNIGSGDLFLDLTKGKELLGIATPGKGQLNAKREIVAALKGVDMVDAFIEPPPEEPGKDDVQILNENNFIQLGEVPTAMGYQDQQRHVELHMALLTEASQAATQLTEAGIQPPSLEGAKKLSNLLAAGIQHTAQHVMLMESIPRVGKEPALYEKAVAELKKSLNNLQQIAQALAEDVQKADQQAQPQMTPEMAKAHQEMEIRQAEAQQKLEIREAEAKQKLGTKALVTQATTEAKMQTHQVTTQLNAEKDQQAMATKAAMDEMELQKKRAVDVMDVGKEVVKTRLQAEQAKEKTNDQS